MIECHDNAIQIQYTRFRRKYYNLIDISRAYDMLELFHEILMYKFLAMYVYVQWIRFMSDLICLEILNIQIKFIV